MHTVLTNCKLFGSDRFSTWPPSSSLSTTCGTCTQQSERSTTAAVMDTLYRYALPTWLHQRSTVVVQ